MGYLHTDSGLFAYGQGLGNRFFERATLASHVRGIHAAGPLRHLRQGDEFGGVAITPGGVDEARGQAESPVVHRLAHQDAACAPIH